MERFRNVAFVIMCAAVVLTSDRSARAEDELCSWIEPSGPGADCQGGPWTWFTNHQNGPVWDFCTYEAPPVCEDFCESQTATVVDSDCWNEGELIEGGGVLHAFDLYIWCKCSDQ
jgi:hypothetical protein